MRENKFRAWKKSESRMIQWDELSQLYGTHLADVLNRVWLEDVMQYIGLKDKNGVEVYEGDVVAVGYVVSALIKYQDAAFIYSTSVGQGLLWDIQPAIIEVIGNIYQNPELLEQNYE